MIAGSVSVLYAQPSGTGGGQGQGGNPPAAGPIDGGAVFLLAGVAGYAHLKLQGKKELQ